MSHLVLRGTYSGKPFPAPQPVLCQQESALLPTLTPAAEMDLLYECLETRIQRTAVNTYFSIFASFCLATYSFE